MSTGSPDARGLVAPEVREALDALAAACAVSQTNRDWPGALAVVEAELERLAAEVERLRGALAFYAEKANHTERRGWAPRISLVAEDGGEVARAALAGDTGEAGT